MLDEASTSESGFYFGQLRKWSKKKSTELDQTSSAESQPKPTVHKEKDVHANISSKDSPSQGQETPVIKPPGSDTVKATPSLVTSPKAVTNKDTPSLYRKKEVKAVEEKKPDAPKQENIFEQSAIDTAWKAFGDMRIKAGASDAEKLVLSRDLSKTDGHDISIHLGSQLEMSILDKFEQEVIQYLRKELANDFINLTKEVKSQVEKQKLYTSQDKFDYMVEQNPALKDLKDKLGLDFEY